MRLFELISTSVYPYEEEMMDGYIEFRFRAEGLNFEVLFTPYYEETGNEDDSDDVWQIEFLRIRGALMPGKQDKFDKRMVDPFKFFGTVEVIALDFLNTRMPDRLVWFAEPKRRKIYRRFKHPQYVFYEDHKNRQNGEPEEGLVRR